MCTFNGELHLEEQLKSLEGQDRPADEIVIRDDASTDSTWELLNDYRRFLPGEIRLIAGDSNLGFLRNFEAAINAASGDLIFLCDQDDIWEPQKVAAFETAFLDQPDVGLVFSDAELIDDAGRPIGRRAWQTSWLKFDPALYDDWDRGGAFRRILKGNVVTGAAMAFRGKFRDLVLPFPADLGQWNIHDGWIALLVSAVARVAPLSFPYIRYRVHSGQSQGLELRPLAPLHDRTPRVVMSGNEIRSRTEAGLTALANRLELHEADFPPIFADLDSVRRHIIHLRTRSAMTMTPLPERWRMIRRELAAGSYARYSSGYGSAVIDLLSPWRNSRPLD
jgi:glycosyltransferase involved in cell wall biosynthesis